MQIKQQKYLPIQLPASALKRNYLKDPERVLGKFWPLAAALANWESATPSHPHQKQNVFLPKAKPTI